MAEEKDKTIKTIIVNHKMYEIQTSPYCTGCMFYDEKNKPHCKREFEINCLTEQFIYVRRIKFFERIMLWFKKKIKK